MPSKHQADLGNTDPAMAEGRAAGAGGPVRGAAAAARARENQRASRARRRELVESLRSRIDEHERRGVQATQEMQQAARAVAEENRRLRALLALHGVSEAEVQQYLSSPDSLVPPRISQPEPGSAAPAPVACAGPPKLAPLQTGRCCGKQQAAVATNGSTIACGVQSTEPALVSEAASEVSSYNPPTDPGHESTAAAFRGKSPSPTSPLRAPVIGPETPHSVLESDCDKAAAILADLQGHGDLQEARQALGCVGEGACVAKNTTVFDLLNEVA